MDISQSLKGKVAVVTGASRGIGKDIANALHEAGATVIISGRHEETLAQSAKDIGERCHPFVCDHSDPSAIQAFADEVLSTFGAPDILVNNAGFMHSEPVVDMSLDLWNRVIATNLTGVFLTTQAFLPGMIKKDRGDIIMISSMSGKKGDGRASAYAASKFGLQGFSQALNYEVRGHNIRVMVLNPSSVDKSNKTSNEEYGKGLKLHSKDIALTVLHLVTLPGRTLIRDMDIWGTNP